MNNILSKILNLVKQYQYDLFLAACIILVAFIGFNIGRINALKQTPIKIEQGANIYKAISNEGAERRLTTNNSIPTSITSPNPQILDPRVVASKNSTKYHHVWCPGAKQIKDANKIWFNNEQEAIKAGYSLTGNCTK